MKLDELPPAPDIVRAAYAELCVTDIEAARRFWGNAVVPSWYEEASPVLSLSGEVRAVRSIAQAAESVVGADGF